MKLDYLCYGCEKQTHDYYMIQNPLWKSIAKPKDKYLCLACVEKRLGRKLKKEDFQSLPINYIYGHLPYEEADEKYKKSILGYWMSQAENQLMTLKKQRRPDPIEIEKIRSFSTWLDDEWAKLKS